MSTDPTEINAQLEEIRASLKRLADDAMCLRRSLSKPKQDRVDELEHALRSVLGNLRIQKTEPDATFYSWAIHRLEDVLNGRTA